MENKSKPKYKLILDAAVEVIAENGYHHSQVSKIAKKAGVADGTIYLYFKNKEDILVSLFEEKMGQFVSKIKDEIEQIDAADQKLYKLIEMHFQQLSDDPSLAIVTQLELRQSNKRLRLKINEVLKGYLTLMDDILHEGMKDGTFQDQLNVKLVRQVLFGTLDEVVTNWVMKEQRYNLVEQAKEVHYLIYNGLRKHN
ncbi:TetR/AcrR family fatty acid metabolism transcriptional regulator [Alkalibacillus filiformis]|uniref:TetR/AcrR family fatty acid metabolism transcriptional regulator n=1 Tax=Alkalibacillus filiformis TaxID=200990 RepID=A0ABU0DRX3_9BACI|nr:TetR/AcrR family transcriptional regulator [Alkalibacillus filiformis]MDQ0351199.1 TetR/AcrR family fatty acid metabolism transcriptional regulator [Alkalibacillus filiformis]